ncbi:hypothetical protein [Vibrio parahaemolyticus]|uniref:hypothetical protein n=1 Tax=Vibrio parahaemolyticus TaxID=670 RepID=UPI00111302F6|nr:hypothetical protein [Vibrio parahaemolyticus]
MRLGSHIFLALIAPIWVQVLLFEDAMSKKVNKVQFTKIGVVSGLSVVVLVGCQTTTAQRSIEKQVDDNRYQFIKNPKTVEQVFGDMTCNEFMQIDKGQKVERFGDLNSTGLLIKQRDAAYISNSILAVIHWDKRRFNHPYGKTLSAETTRECLKKGNESLVHQVISESKFLTPDVTTDHGDYKVASTNDVLYAVYTGSKERNAVLQVVPRQASRNKGYSVKINSFYIHTDIKCEDMNYYNVLPTINNKKYYVQNTCGENKRMRTFIRYTTGDKSAFNLHEVISKTNDEIVVDYDGMKTYRFSSKGYTAALNQGRELNQVFPFGSEDEWFNYKMKQSALLNK